MVPFSATVLEMTVPEIAALALVVLVVLGAVIFFFVTRRPGSIEQEVASARSGSAGTLVTSPLRDRLARSREALGGSLRTVFGRGRVDEELWNDLEEALIASDVGVEASTAIVDRVRERTPEGVEQAKTFLRDELLGVLSGRTRSLTLRGEPAVILVVGVNGTGKTTSIGKISHRLRSEGRSPLLGAADTFRAAADTQLRTWADRVGIDMVGGQAGADPAAVAFDALSAARARANDVVIVDTAGRLHAKRNLMEELGKIRRVLEREAGAIGEVLLVLDATAGQNGIAQARSFAETASVTGIVLTKLDGTAKGGVVVAIEEQLGVPVKLIGVGEGIEDLIPFEPESFVDALLADV